MPMALGPTCKGLSPAKRRTLRAMAGSASSPSVAERSSPAWTSAEVVKLTRSSSSTGGRLRFSSVK